MREVIAAYKKMMALGGTFSIVGVSSEVMEVFRLTGFEGKMDIREVAHE